MSLESLPEINPIAAEFSRKHRAEERKLSEIFAFYIVHSETMRTFFAALFDRYGEFISYAPDRARNIDLIVEKMGLAIIGRKIERSLTALARNHLWTI